MVLFRLLSGVWACLVVLVAHGQGGRKPSSDKVLTRCIAREKVLQDLRLFQGIQEKAHAGLYKYRTKAQLDSAFAQAQAQVTDSMTILAVYRLVAGITDFEGSLHSDTLLPDSVAGAMHRQTAFFPLPVKFLGGTLRLDYAAASLPVGTEILSVNGQLVPQLTQALGRYYTTDGFNQTGKQAGLSRYFAEYFYLCYGPLMEFQVAVRPPGRTATQLQSFKAVDYTTVEERYRHRHSLALDSATRPYGFRVAGPAAIFTLRTFDIGDNAHSPAHQSYRRFLDSCFAVVHATPTIAGVLIDVRGNGGGTDPNDMLTFSYLAQRPFRENKTACVSFRTIPYGSYLQTEHRGLRRWREKRQLQRELRREFMPAPAGPYYQREHANPLYQPNRLRTTKPVYLLIDGRVASATAMFSAMVRGITAAVVVGEETMGGYYGHTGHTPVEYRLPNTGIITKFSLVDLVQDVPVKASQPPGRGTLPDYPVVQSEAEFIANDDAQLAFALKLLAEQAKAPRK